MLLMFTIGEELEVCWPIVPWDLVAMVDDVFVNRINAMFCRGD